MRITNKTNYLTNFTLGILSLSIAGGLVYITPELLGTQKYEVPEVGATSTSDSTLTSTQEAEVSGKAEHKKSDSKKTKKSIPKSSTNSTSSQCQKWAEEAGITDFATAYKLIMKESSCNPNAVNKASGACGIGQQLPCGKWEHKWNDPVGGMKDMQKYVFQRYGSWKKALEFHNQNGWY